MAKERVDRATQAPDWVTQPSRFRIVVMTILPFNLVEHELFLLDTHTHTPKKMGMQ